MLLALCCALLLVVALLGGCAGSDGGAGPTGPAGSTGPAGPAGPTGAAASVFGTHNITLGNVDQTVSNIAVSNVGGVPKVSFHLATAAGPVKTLAATQIRVYLADMVPAGTFTSSPTGTISTPYFEQWAYEQNSTAGKTFDTSGAANGDYSWTFSAPFGTATAGSGLNVAEYNAAHVQRLVLRISGDSTVAKTNNTVAIQDFNVPAAGAQAQLLASPQRQFVTIQACQKCHSKFMDNAAHASGYLDTNACVICHSPLYGSSSHAVGFMDADDTILPVFIHQIHASKYTNANQMPNAKGQYLVEQPITFPQDIKNCAVCHTGTGDQIDNWKNHPTRRVCASCHKTVIFTDATATFVGLDGVTKTHSKQDTDSACSMCHDATGTGNTPPSMTEAHSTAPAGQEAPEYNVVISMSTPSNGTHYVAGETPLVTVTLTNPDGTAVPTGLTAAAGHIVGTYDVNSLSIANMYVYGNRTSPRPVLIQTAGRSDTNPKANLAKSINLMSSYYAANRTAPYTPTGPFTVTDPYRTATPTGWTYQLGPVTADMKGTYFVRVYLGNRYTTINPADAYQIVSYGIKAFQVGTATEDKRIAGNADNTASCLNCHGSSVMHASDHAAPFDTDHCNSCHYIGAYGNSTIGASGDPIANRVHAVHDSSAVGDLKNHDWSEITYPSKIERCVVCHNSGNTSYKTNLYEIPCYGCHADVTGAIAHMSSMGGSITSVVSGTTGTTTVAESCVVCHGPGRDADIAD